ncbi:MAG: thiol-disulfide oxidoreductase DCC family protein [Adhaeribacter sp.]
MDAQPAIILFDGVCNLCNGFVQFVIRQDHAQRFRFASLQSDKARELLQGQPGAGHSLDSVVLIENGRHYRQSTAALRILRHLSGGWPLLYGLVVVPAFVRDRVYAWVAGNRYRWFGQRDACMLPTPELKARFL